MRHQQTMLVLLLLLGALGAGCISPAETRMQNGAENGASNVAPGTVLYVSAIVGFGAIAEAQPRVRFGLSTSNPNEIREIFYDGAGARSERIAKTAVPAAIATPPISGIVMPDNMTDALSALAGLDDLVPVMTNATQRTYALLGSTANPGWVITDIHGTTTARSIVAVATGVVSGVDPSPPTPLLPSLAAPDFGALSALAIADPVATSWSPDAILCAIMTREVTMPGMFDFYFESVGTEEFFVPPDFSFGDGKSALWVFIYYSPSLQFELPVVVYASAIAVLGDPIPARYTPADYGDKRAGGAFIDSVDAVTVFDPDVHFVMVMQLEVGTHWHLYQAGDKIALPHRGAVVNMYTGAVASCVPDEWC